MHDELANELKGQDGTVTGLPTQLFDFRCLKHLKCEKCGYKRERSEVYRDLSVDLENPGSGTADLQMLFLSHFKEEILEYTCEECGCPVATSSHELQTYPALLAVHVKRFLPNASNTRVIERNDRVDVPPMLLLDGNRYTLSSIVSHLGQTTESGHYVTYAACSAGWK